MRGQQLIFSNLIDLPVKEKQAGIGRNKELVARRNTKIIYRYYWYTQHQPQRLDYSFIIGELSNEFDISDFRIIIIMQENHAELKQVFAEKPTIKELQKKYAYLSW